VAEQMVRMFDVRTRRLTTIPVRELAAGMVRIRVEGSDCEVWVDASQGLPGQLKHPHFGEDVRAVLADLQDTFRDVYPRTLEEWEDGFRRDDHPEWEIAVWLHMGRAYRHFIGGRALSAEQKREIFDVILAAVNNGREYVRLTTNPLTLSPMKVREIVDFVCPGPPEGNDFLGGHLPQDPAGVELRAILK
jgi:hypothetical protein